MRHLIAVIIANDAVPNIQPYERVGPMSAIRIAAALDWDDCRRHSPHERRIWACGAGVKDPTLPGRTLAELNMYALFD